jgi:hypothetical protein
MTPRFRFHRPHLDWHHFYRPHFGGPHFDWLADLALLFALAALVMATAVLCSFVPWS